ncbi:MAG: hypothetical protein ABIG71_00290 [Candidatus Uhrbacteria bacterium]
MQRISWIVATVLLIAIALTCAGGLGLAMFAMPHSMAINDMATGDMGHDESALDCATYCLLARVVASGVTALPAVYMTIFGALLLVLVGTMQPAILLWFVPIRAKTHRDPKEILTIVKRE